MKSPYQLTGVENTRVTFVVSDTVKVHKYNPSIVRVDKDLFYI